MKNQILIIVIMINLFIGCAESLNKKIKIAESFQTSQEKLARLASDENVEVRKRVALNANTPLEVLSILAADINDTVRYCVSVNPISNYQILKMLANDQIWEIREIVREHPNLKKIETFCKNNNTSPDTLDTLARKNIHPVINVAIAKNWNTNKETLFYLTSSKNINVRMAIANNPITSVEILKILLKDKNNNICSVIAEREDLTPEILRILADCEDLRTRELVAKNMMTPYDALDIIAKDRFPSTRALVAKHPNTSSNTLEFLANDDNFYVLHAVLGNTGTPQNSLKNIIPKIDEEIVRMTQEQSSNYETFKQARQKYKRRKELFYDLYLAERCADIKNILKSYTNLRVIFQIYELQMINYESRDKNHIMTGIRESFTIELYHIENIPKLIETMSFSGEYLPTRFNIIIPGKTFHHYVDLNEVRDWIENIYINLEK